jgi:molybdenum cofactor cytidylyltransferase
MNVNVDPFRLGVVLLAAGRSTRMGRPKLLLPWQNTTILGHLLAQWNQLGAVQIAVVHATDDTSILAELDRLNHGNHDRIANPAPEHGMFSSLQCASSWPAWRTELTHVAIVLGDQPHISSDTLRALLAFSSAHTASVTQPYQDGHRRHPVILPKPIFAGVATSDSTDLKQFLAGQQLSLFECSDMGLALDIDTPDDYQRALEFVRLTTRQ